VFTHKTTTESFFAANPVFTADEFNSTFAGKNSRANQSLLDYHVRAGNIMRIRRGLFATIPATITQDNFVVNPYLVACKLAKDSVVSHHAALGYYGATHTNRRIISYTTKHKSAKSFNFQNWIFQPVLTPKALIDAGKERLLVDTEPYQGGIVSVTAPGRTFVDCVDKLELAGGLEEVVRSCDDLLFLEPEPIIEYLAALNNATITAKVGYILEFQTRLAEFPGILDTLRNHLPHSPTYLFRQERHGKLISGWNLIVPEWVLEKRWEEKH
jgi:predicted transcriptional regulator of viral defense system